MGRERRPGLDGTPALVAHIPRAGCAALAVAYLLSASAYNALTPVFEAADEHAHYFVAQHIAWEGRLPVQSRSPSEPWSGPWEQEGSQPPLYYSLVAPLVRLTGSRITADTLRYNHQNTMGQPALVGNENRFIHPPQREGWPWHGYALAVHLMRGVSTLLGLVTVLAAVWLGWQVFPGRGHLALAVGALVAFNPQFLHTSAAVSNDVAIAALATLGVALLLSWWNAPSVRRALAIGLVVALATLAKVSGVALLAFVVSTFLAHAARRRRVSPAFQAGIIVVAWVVLVAGWWYARNQRLYGSWTGIEAMLGDQLRRDVRLGPWLSGLPAELWGVWLSFWGVFGWFTVMLPGWLYGLYSLLAIGGLLGALAAWRRRMAWVAWPKIALLALWCGFVAVALLRWLTLTKGGAGRLLFPAIAALAAIWVLGWRHLVPWPTDRGLAAALAGTLVVLAWLALWTALRPAYAWPTLQESSRLPPTALGASVVFGEGLRLKAVNLPRRVREGEHFPVTLYWRVEAPLRRDGYVAIRLDQLVADEVASGQGWRRLAGRPWLAYLAQGNAPPDLLAPRAETYVDRRVVRAPESEAVFRSQPAVGRRPQVYRLPIAAELSVHVYDMAAQESWPVYDLAGRPVPGGFRIPIVIEPRSAPDRRRFCVGRPVARFANGMSLYLLGEEGERGDERPEKVVPPGGTVELQVAWGAERPPGTDLHAFVHLVAASQRPIAQADGPLATHGYYPTSLWPAKECLPARFTMAAPSDSQPGTSLSVLAGLYVTGHAESRIAATRPDGRPWPESAVHLANVRLAP